MGGCVMLMAAKGETKKMRPFFNKIAQKIDDYWSLPGPEVDGIKVDRIILQFSGKNEIELEYNFGQGSLPGDFALAFGKELCRHFKITKAGWDAVGYAKEGVVWFRDESQMFCMEKRMWKDIKRKMFDFEKFEKAYIEHVKELFKELE